MSSVAAVSPEPSRAVPLATTQVQLELNLDSRTPVSVDDPTAAWNDILTARTYGVSFEIYDAAGRSIQLILWFRKVGVDLWQAYMTMGIGLGLDGQPGPVAPLTATPFRFAVDGSRLLDDIGVMPIEVRRGGGLPPISLTVTLTDIVQYGAPSNVTMLKVDGHP